jgi:FkbM family methyltransferase
MRSWQDDWDSSMTTRELLSETVDSARARENSAFGELAIKGSGRIVLFGAGRLGQKVAGALRPRGVGPLAFIDNDPRLHGTKLAGIPVLSPAAGAERWRNDALFVVTTFLPGGGGVQARLRDLELLGCRQNTSFLPIGWKCGGVLPHFGADQPSRLLAHAVELIQVGALWCDDLSQETFRQALAWRLHADFEEITSPAPDQYFPRDILRANPDEVFVDGGAYNGDTLRAAPWQFAKILAIEPDPANAAILRTSCGKNALVHEVLLGRSAGSARFEAAGTMASSRSDAGALKVSVATLDEVTAGENPTFLKLDVEGDELAALQGGIEILQRAKPVVAVCVYHRPEDLWTIPLFLHEVLPAHRLFLRAHAWDGFELVAYAIPHARCLIPR